MGTVIKFVLTPVLVDMGLALCLTLVEIDMFPLGSPAFDRVCGLSGSGGSMGWFTADVTCRWFMCACKSLWDKYVRLHPLEP